MTKTETKARLLDARIRYYGFTHEAVNKLILEKLVKRVPEFYSLRDTPLKLRETLLKKFWPERIKTIELIKKQKSLRKNRKIKLIDSMLSKGWEQL